MNFNLMRDFDENEMIGHPIRKIRLVNNLQDIPKKIYILNTDKNQEKKTKIMNTFQKNSISDRIQLKKNQNKSLDMIKNTAKANQNYLTLQERIQIKSQLDDKIDQSKQDSKSYPIPILSREQTQQSLFDNNIQLDQQYKKYIQKKSGQLMTQSINSKRQENKVQQIINRPIESRIIKLNKAMDTQQSSINILNQPLTFTQPERKIIKFTKSLIGDNQYLNFSLMDESDFEKLCQNLQIVGTCQNLEKPFLRLTEIPHPSNIRPENILKKSLELLQNKQYNKQQQIDFDYISEQYRSIRQDLTIQHIKNEFTCEVYEENCRYSLLCKDIQQFNQCQSKLNELYKEGIQGNKYVNRQNIKIFKEFLSYRIIYLTLTQSQFELISILQSLNLEDFQNQQLKEALNFKKSYDSDLQINRQKYKIIDKIIYQQIKNMGFGYHILVFADHVNTQYLSNILAFNNKETCVKFLNMELSKHFQIFQIQDALISNDDTVNLKQCQSKLKKLIFQLNKSKIKRV